MAKEKQQELPEQPQQPEVTRLAVSISKPVGGKYTIEELHLAGDKVVYTEVLVVKSSGLRVASGEMLLVLEERLSHWQREGMLK